MSKPIARCVRLEPCPNGPLLVRGADHIVDEGRRYKVERPVVALCRCHASAAYPFCDATHKLLNKRAKS